MKIDGSKTNYVYYWFIRHNDVFCLSCTKKMKIIKCTKVVNSNSPEAKDYNFYIAEGFLSGNIKFSWFELECPQCGRRITAEQGYYWVKIRKEKEAENKYCIFKRNNSK